jgi:hypothetical protein
MRATRRLHPPIGFVAQPTNPNLLGFEGQTQKPSRCFWSPNHQTIAAGFEAQTGKPAIIRFKAKPVEIVAVGFDAKPGEIVYHTQFLCQNQVLIVCMSYDQLFHTYGQKCSQIIKCHE